MAHVGLVPRLSAADSRALFEGLEVSRRDGWDKSLNKYNVLRAIGGEELRVNPARFQNDMASVTSRDDALTLLV